MDHEDWLTGEKEETIRAYGATQSLGTQLAGKTRPTDVADIQMYDFKVSLQIIQNCCHVITTQPKKI